MVSESQLNRKGRKIQNSSNKNKKLETKLKSWKKMSELKMTKSSMATNTSNNGKDQFHLVTEPAEQKIVKPKTEALKKCGCCYSRHFLPRFQFSFKFFILVATVLYLSSFSIQLTFTAPRATLINLVTWYRFNNIFSISIRFGLFLTF
jgi:hypothetical protein